MPGICILHLFFQSVYYDQAELHGIPKFFLFNTVFLTKSKADRTSSLSNSPGNPMDAERVISPMIMPSIPGVSMIRVRLLTASICSIWAITIESSSSHFLYPGIPGIILGTGKSDAPSAGRGIFDISYCLFSFFL